MSWRDRAKPYRPEEEAQEDKPKSSWRERALTIKEYEALEAGKISDAESLARGAGQGITFGFQDEASALLETIVGKATDVFRDEKLYGDSFAQEYRDNRDAYRKDNQEAQEANPIAYGVGEFGGGVASSALPVAAAGRLAKGTGMVANAAKAYKGGKAAALAAGAGIEGSLYGLGASESESAKEILTDAGKMGLMGVGFSAGLSTLVAGGGAIGNKLFKAAKNGKNKIEESFLPMLAKTFGNIDEDVTRAYLKNPKKYQKVKTIEQLKDHLDDVIIKRRAGKEGAEEAYQAAKIKYKEALQDTFEDLRQEQAILKGDLDFAKNDYSMAKRQSKYELKNQGIPKSVISNVEEGVGKLKERVIQGSDEAFGILQKEFGDVPAFSRENIKKAFNSGLDELKIEGRPPISGKAVKGFKQIQGEIDNLGQMPERLKASSVKKIIQDLESDITELSKFGDFNSPDVVARKKIRYLLDQELKQASPAYANKMKDVAADAEFLTQVNQRFGDETRIQNRLTSLHKNKNSKDVEMLQKLNDLTENTINFREIDQISDSFKVAENPQMFEDVMQQTPEFERFKKAETLYQDFPNPKKTSAQLNEPLARVLQDKEKAMKLAKEEFQRLGLNEKTSENVVRAFERGNPSIDQVRIVEEVAPGLMEELKNARIGGAFLRSDTQGSRKTVFGAVLGSFFGGWGGSTGATLGFISDRYSGTITKKALDSYASLSGGAGKIMNALKVNPQQFGKYAKPLSEAAQRGTRALSASLYVLQKRDPEFAEKYKEITEAEDE